MLPPVAKQLPEIDFFDFDLYFGIPCFRQGCCVVALSACRRCLLLVATCTYCASR